MNKYVNDYINKHNTVLWHNYIIIIITLHNIMLR